MTKSDNYNRFIVLYAKNLQQVFNDDPNYYKGQTCNPKTHALKMTEGLIIGSANKNGKAIKLTCKQLGIKHTYKDIQEYLKS